MNSFITNRKTDLERLCERFGVLRLELFGSAAGEGFDPQSSDMDFLVEFIAPAPGKRADVYFGLLEELEALFNRPVDLVMTRAVRNPYFLQAISSTRTSLYAA